ncbi:unnamed protein product, partial [Trichobilharzia regenti]
RNIDPPKDRSNDCIFGLKTNESDWYFCAESPDDAAVWRIALSEVKGLTLPRYRVHIPPPDAPPPGYTDGENYYQYGCPPETTVPLYQASAGRQYVPVRQKNLIFVNSFLKQHSILLLILLLYNCSLGFRVKRLQQRILTLPYFPTVFSGPTLTHSFSSSPLTISMLVSDVPLLVVSHSCFTGTMTWRAMSFHGLLSLRHIYLHFLVRIC